MQGTEAPEYGSSTLVSTPRLAPPGHGDKEGKYWAVRFICCSQQLSRAQNSSSRARSPDRRLVTRRCGYWHTLVSEQVATSHSLAPFLYHPSSAVQGDTKSSLASASPHDASSPPSLLQLFSVRKLRMEMPTPST